MGEETTPKITLDFDKKPAAILAEVISGEPPMAVPAIPGSDQNLPAVLEVKSLAVKKVSDYLQIADEHKEQARQLAEKFDFKDTSATITFAAAPQKKYVDTLKFLLGNAKVKDTGQASDIVLSITKGIEMVGLEQMKKELTPWTFARFMAGLPIIGTIFSHIHRFAAQQEKLQQLIDDTEKKTQKEMLMIIEGNARLDVMFGDVEENFYELGVYIYAGELALERGKKEYEVLRQQALVSSDPVAISKVNLFREQVISFDSRLLRVKTAYAKAPVTIQKILTTQQAGRIELNNLMESLLFDLPAFMESLLILLSLFNLEKAQNNRRDREKLRERLEALEGDFLDRVATTAKADQARGAKEVKMVEASANKILETVKKMKELDDQNATLRRDSENLLVDVIQGFQESMKEVNKPEALPAT
jgi:uncharacterized protein YaaN involved in tellurite resistance